MADQSHNLVSITAPSLSDAASTCPVEQEAMQTAKPIAMNAAHVQADAATDTLSTGRPKLSTTSSLGMIKEAKEKPSTQRTEPSLDKELSLEEIGTLTQQIKVSKTNNASWSILLGGSQALDGVGISRSFVPCSFNARKVKGLKAQPRWVVKAQADEVRSKINRLHKSRLKNFLAEETRLERSSDQLRDLSRAALSTDVPGSSTTSTLSVSSLGPVQHVSSLLVDAPCINAQDEKRGIGRILTPPEKATGMEPAPSASGLLDTDVRYGKVEQTGQSFHTPDEELVQNPPTTNVAEHTEDVLLDYGLSVRTLKTSKTTSEDKHSVSNESSAEKSDLIVVPPVTRVFKSPGPAKVFLAYAKSAVFSDENMLPFEPDLCKIHALVIALAKGQEISLSGVLKCVLLPVQTYKQISSAPWQEAMKKKDEVITTINAQKMELEQDKALLEHEKSELEEDLQIVHVALSAASIDYDILRSSFNDQRQKDRVEVQKIIENKAMLQAAHREKLNEKLSEAKLDKEREVKALKVRYESRIDEANARLLEHGKSVIRQEELQSELKAVTQENFDLTLSKAAKEKEISELKVDVNRMLNFEDAYDQVKKELTQLQADHEDLRAELDELQTRLHVSEAKLKDAVYQQSGSNTAQLLPVSGREGDGEHLWGLEELWTTELKRKVEAVEKKREEIVRIDALIKKHPHFRP